MDTTTIAPVNNGEAERLSAVPRIMVAQGKAVFEAVTDNTNRNFKGQQKHEVVHCFSRKHWIVLVPSFLVSFGLFLIIPIFFIAFSPDELRSMMSSGVYKFLAILAIGVFTYYHHNFFIKLFNYYLQIFIVTNLRVLQLEQTLYFNHVRNSIDLHEIQDIMTQKKGIFKTLFNYGEIIITLSSSYVSKTFNFVPNPEYYFRKINKTKGEYFLSRRK